MNTRCQLCDGLLIPYCQTIMFGRKANLSLCTECKSQNVVEPDWLELSYDQGWANTDTGRVIRAMQSAKDIIFTLSLSKCYSSSNQILDYGGGEGVLTRTLRDHGLDAFNFDPYVSQNLSSGYNLTEIPNVRKFAVILLIEVLEHLTNPRESLGTHLENSDLVFLSISTLPNENANPNDDPIWDYYSLEEGQHVLFPTDTGLGRFFDTFGLRYYFKVGSLRVYSRTPLPKLLRILSLNKFIFFAAKLILVRLAGKKSKHGSDANQIRIQLRENLKYRKNP